MLNLAFSHKIPELTEERTNTNCYNPLQDFEGDFLLPKRHL
jgi:hypothetical protein